MLPDLIIESGFLEIKSRTWSADHHTDHDMNKRRTARSIHYPKPIGVPMPCPEAYEMSAVDRLIYCLNDKTINQSTPYYGKVVGAYR